MTPSFLKTFWESTKVKRHTQYISCSHRSLVDINQNRTLRSRDNLCQRPAALLTWTPVNWGSVIPRLPLLLPTRRQSSQYSSPIRWTFLVITSMPSLELARQEILTAFSLSNMLCSLGCNKLTRNTWISTWPFFNRLKLSTKRINSNRANSPQALRSFRLQHPTTRLLHQITTFSLLSRWSKHNSVDSLTLSRMKCKSETGLIFCILFRASWSCCA